ncbi:VWA domain-containing protein [Marihabitans asiaticum]|uniref:von Willebrand factor type A domain-containing protein n=1 Tax=Marihabitans asiaticum TaxID=415218 RepID=A0A560WG50_9MICO|nr:VWA domain-containing protein [Marihabitans asiaticum]TWD16526.1 von Willebrand factor type A domain-containing protein [Marihabitans asiaticum]
MDLRWWWLGLALVLAAAVTAVLAWRRARQGRSGEVVRAAHTGRLTRLAAYQNALSRLRLQLAALAVLLTLVVLPAAWAASRPADSELSSPERRNRDIMLCLDVSGSMFVTDQAILRSFANLATGFEGERIGLVLFDAQAVTAFPLTDDYDLVRTQLEEYADGFATFGADGSRDPQAGTWNPSIQGTSLIPDGVASCTQAFDHPEEERPRAIVLGTDNLVAGEGVYTHEEAFGLAQEQGVRVYALDPGFSGRPHEQLSTLTEQTGGRTYQLEDPEAVTQITEEIQRLEAARLPEREPALLRVDAPRWPMLALAVALLAYLGLAWRWRR